MGSGCLFLAFTDLENGLFVTENGVEIFNEFGEDSALEKVNVFGTVVRTVCKEVLFGRMSVEVKIKFNTPEMFLPDL
jgi:hypothetical protein